MVCTSKYSTMYSGGVLESTVECTVISNPKCQPVKLSRIEILEILLSGEPKSLESLPNLEHIGLRTIVAETLNILN